MPRATVRRSSNKSMSEVVTRSLVTSFSTVIGVIALLIFGGEVLRSFAIAILVGVASGTYSSIFIATPVLAWKEHEPATFKRRRRQQIETQGSVPAFASDLEVAPQGSERGNGAESKAGEEVQSRKRPRRKAGRTSIP